MAATRAGFTSRFLDHNSVYSLPVCTAGVLYLFDQIHADWPLFLSFLDATVNIKKPFVNFIATKGYGFANCIDAINHCRPSIIICHAHNPINEVSTSNMGIINCTLKLSSSIEDEKIHELPGIKIRSQQFLEMDSSALDIYELNDMNDHLEVVIKITYNVIELPELLMKQYLTQFQAILQTNMQVEWYVEYEPYYDFNMSLRSMARQALTKVDCYDPTFPAYDSYNPIYTVDSRVIILGKLDTQSTISAIADMSETYRFMIEHYYTVCMRNYFINTGTG